MRTIRPSKRVGDGTSTAVMWEEKARSPASDSHHLGNSFYRNYPLSESFQPDTSPVSLCGGQSCRGGGGGGIWWDGVGSVCVGGGGSKVGGRGRESKVGGGGGGHESAF